MIKVQKGTLSQWAQALAESELYQTYIDEELDFNGLSRRLKPIATIALLDDNQLWALTDLTMGTFNKRYERYFAEFFSEPENYLKKD